MSAQIKKLPAQGVAGIGLTLGAVLIVAIVTSQGLLPRPMPQPEPTQTETLTVSQTETQTQISEVQSPYLEGTAILLSAELTPVSAISGLSYYRLDAYVNNDYEKGMDWLTITVHMEAVKPEGANDLTPSISSIVAGEFKVQYSPYSRVPDHSFMVQILQGSVVYQYADWEITSQGFTEEGSYFYLYCAFSARLWA